MKSLLSLILFASSASPQATRNQGVSDPAWKAFYTNRTAVRRRGSEALYREQTRSKANLCSKAEAGGDAEIGACLVAEEKTTEQDYLTYIRAIGALLRLPAPGDPQINPEKLPFDVGEEAWRNYRDHGCDAVSSQYEGGTEAPIAYRNCRLALTWHHMNELAELYSDLWH